RHCYHLLCTYSPPTPRPPHSTLFPYTTLFRSVDVCKRWWCFAGSNCSDAVPRLRQQRIQVQRQAALDDGARQRQRIATQRERVLDRKSTRLNSSHVKISYAVFCLKKKQKPYAD